MKIFDINGNMIEDPDLNLGYLVHSQRPIVHRYHVTQEEVGHYEVVKEYPNGGKDVEWIIDIPEEGCWIAHDENGVQIDCDNIVPDDAPHEIDIDDVETVAMYILYNEEELSQIRVEEMIETTPSQMDIIEAQVTYTAMMTDTLLEV